MPDVDFTADGPEEELLPQRRRPAPRRLSIALAVAIAAVAVGVILTHGHSPSRTTASRTSSAGTSSASTSSANTDFAGTESAGTDSAASPATSVPATSRLLPGIASPRAPATAAVGGVPLSDALVSTGVFTESGSLGSQDFTYDFDVVNDSAVDLPISYPIRVVGPGNVAIPVVFAGIYDQTRAREHMNDSMTPAHRLAQVGRAMPASLLVRIHIDCDNSAMTGLVPSEQPAIEVHLRGVRTPAVFAFADLASGFDDAVRQVCGL